MVSSTLGLCRNRSGDKRTFRLCFAPGPGIHLDSDIRSAKREARADWLEYGRFWIILDAGRTNQLRIN